MGTPRVADAVPMNTPIPPQRAAGQRITGIEQRRMRFYYFAFRQFI